MRSSLIGSLLQVLKFNLDRKAPRVNVFEVGRVFLRDPAVTDTDTTVAGFGQPLRIAGLAYGPRVSLQWGQSEKMVDFFDVKGDLEALLAPLPAVFKAAEHSAMHPGRCASVSVAGQLIGFVGEIHPKWRQSCELALAPIAFELDFEAVMQRRIPGYNPVGKIQPVERDIAVIVPEATTHGVLMAAIYASDTGGLLRLATLFDVYRPQAGTAHPHIHAQEKSLAARLVFASDTTTLTDELVEAAVLAVLGNLKDTLNARLRA